MKENIFIDPAFLRKSNYSYVNYNGDELATVLCFALARNKRDLILHQQRIEYYAKYQKNKLLFTSIVDLFIALENKGENYKSRILNKYRKYLKSDQALFLTKNIINGVSSLDPISDLNQSLFNYGNVGQLLESNSISEN